MTALSAIDLVVRDTVGAGLDRLAGKGDTGVSHLVANARKLDGGRA